jgi:hypothetical protein
MQIFCTYILSLYFLRNNIGANDASRILVKLTTGTQYRFPSLFAVDTFRHFGPLDWKIVILDHFIQCEKANSQIKSPRITRTYCIRNQLKDPSIFSEESEELIGEADIDGDGNVNYEVRQSFL